MDGEIGAESRNGEGATFWFSLVLPKASGQDHGGRPALPPDAPARAARVLLADDLEENREIAKAYLEKAGHQVDVVADGAQAVAAVETGRYDLVLMDVRMPGVDGVAATHRIRALGPPTGDVPIIAFSANVLPEQVAEFRKAGMNGHLAKPVQREELQRLLQRWVSHRSDAGAGRQAASTGSGSAVIPSRPGQGEGAWASIEALAAYAESTFTKLLAALGPERVVDLVDKATSRLGSAFGPDPADAHEAEALASDAHALIALLGMLGFERFSALCQALENACRSGDDLGPLLEAAQEARSRILDELPVLRGVASRAGTFQSGTAPRALSRRPT